MLGAGLGIFNALFSGLRLLYFIQIASSPSKIWRHIDFKDDSRNVAISLLISFLATSRSKSTSMPNFGGIYLSVSEIILPVSVNKCPPPWNSTSGFVFRDFAYLERSKSTCRPNFGNISQSTAEILLLPVYERKPPPCWNSTSGLDFHVCVALSMPFCICLPNFVQIGPSTTTLWRHIHLSSWQPQHRNSTFGFVFREFVHLGRSKSTCRPNFGEISESTVEILLLRVSENKRMPWWNSISGFDFHVCSPSACHSASACQLSSKSNHPQQSSDVIFIFKMAVTASQFYFRFGFSWVRSFGKVEIYRQTKFRRDISIHSWDTTTSVFWKETSTMLEFYFRFWFSFFTFALS